jgi:hypothetical protein
VKRYTVEREKDVREIRLMRERERERERERRLMYGCM